MTDTSRPCTTAAGSATSAGAHPHSDGSPPESTGAGLTHPAGTDCLLAARRRALERQCRPIPLPAGAGAASRWSVASTTLPGRTYIVAESAGGGGFVCTCPAGTHDVPCCHAAAVELLLHPELVPAPATEQHDAAERGATP